METEFKPIEAREREPSFKTTFLFSAHNTAADFEMLEPLLSKADIYISEASEWEPEAYKKIVDISEGRCRPDSKNKERGEMSAQEFEDNLLFDSKKPVFFIDPPKDHAIEAIEKEASERSQDSYNAFFYTGLQDAIKQMDESLVLSGQYLEARDTFVAGELRNIKRILDLYPNLKTKKEINVIIQLGIAHKTIVERIPSQFTKEEIVDGIPSLYDETAIEKMKGHEVTDETLARVIVEQIIFQQINSLRGSSKKTSIQLKLIRHIVSALTLADISSICLTTTNAFALADYDRTQFSPEAKFVEVLARKTGIKLPTNDKEFDILVQNLGIKDRK